MDLGGTNVRAGAFYRNGQPAGEDFSQPSRAQEGTDVIIESLAETIQRAIHAADGTATAIGLAIPGHVDNSRGVVRWAPNFGHTVDGVFVSWKDVAIRAPLRDRIPLPLAMGNDANMAALGEYRYGAGRGDARCLVMLTVGTGIGGGVIMSPRSVLGKASGPLVLVGGNEGGGELGHIIVQYGGLDCNAGTYGALEAYCQRDSIVQRAVHRLRRGCESIIRDLVQGDLSSVEPRTIGIAADQGDELAREVWDEVGEMLGVGIGTLINVFAPDVFAIGGQISMSAHHFLPKAIRTAENTAVTSLFSDCKIVKAEKLEDAGMLGAAALAFESTEWEGKA